MKIGIDLDGVIADLTTELVYRLDKIGIKTNPYRWKSLRLENEIDGVSADWMAEQINDPLFYMNVPAYEDAFYAINEWFYSGNDVYIITTRPTDCLDVSQDWLDQWGIPYNNIYAGIKHREKIEVINDLNIAAMVEDNPEECEVIVETGINTFIISRSWNRDYKFPGRVPIRTSDLYGVTNHLARYSDFKLKRKRI